MQQNSQYTTSEWYKFSGRDNQDAADILVRHGVPFAHGKIAHNLQKILEFVFGAAHEMQSGKYDQLAQLHPDDYKRRFSYMFDRIYTIPDHVKMVEQAGLVRADIVNGAQEYLQSEGFVFRPAILRRALLVIDPAYKPAYLQAVPYMRGPK